MSIFIQERWQAVQVLWMGSVQKIGDVSNPVWLNAAQPQQFNRFLLISYRKLQVSFLTSSQIPISKLLPRRAHTQNCTIYVNYLVLLYRKLSLGEVLEAYSINRGSSSKLLLLSEHFNKRIMTNVLGRQGSAWK